MDYRTGMSVHGADYNPFTYFGAGAQAALETQPQQGRGIFDAFERESRPADYPVPRNLPEISRASEPMPAMMFDRHYPALDPHWQPPVNDTPYNPDPSQIDFYAGGPPRKALAQTGSALWNLLGSPLSTFNAGPFNASVQYDPMVGRESFGARAGMSFRF